MKSLITCYYPALGIEADTGAVAKALCSMSGKPGLQATLKLSEPLI